MNSCPNQDSKFQLSKQKNQLCNTRCDMNFDFTIVPFLTYVYVQRRIMNSCSNDCIKLEIMNVLVSRKEKILYLSFHICRIYGYAWQVGVNNPVEVFIVVTSSFVFIIALDFARLHKNNAGKCYNII